MVIKVEVDARDLLKTENPILSNLSEKDVMKNLRINYDNAKVITNRPAAL
jgi:NRPS condensation-like uncharacterized protein